MNAHYPFALPPLPYDYDALAPQLDAKTLLYHHDRHFAAYVEGLNALLAAHPAWQDWSLPRLCRDWAALPAEIRQQVRNQAGGVYNHDLYFRSLAPGPASAPSAALSGALRRAFGGLDSFRQAMKTAALTQFGSGWAWLCLAGDGELTLAKTANQDTPLPLQGLLCCDVWEHAYYLGYQNRRGDYFDAWWERVDWPAVSARYGEALAFRPPIPLP